MNTSINQHYVPKMLLRQFTDQNGYLFCCRRLGSESKIWKQKPCKAFRQKNLYTRYDNDGSIDQSIETEQFARLEGDASPIIDEIVERAMKGRLLRLDKIQKEILLTFLIHQYRRAPEFQTIVEQNMDELIRQIPEKFSSYAGRQLTQEELGQIEHPNFSKTIKQNSFPEFAAAKLKERKLGMFMDTSIFVGVIRDSNKSFVIGSQSMRGFHNWFPLHCKVAIKLERPRGIDNLIFFENISEIRQINKDIVKRSTTFAGRSEELIKSLSRPR